MLTITATIALFLSLPGHQDTQKEKADDQKVVCKREAKTGTRFPVKTCKTRAQWEEISEAAKRTGAETFNKPSINGERGN